MRNKVALRRILSSHSPCCQSFHSKQEERMWNQEGVNAYQQTSDPLNDKELFFLDFLLNLFKTPSLSKHRNLSRNLCYSMKQKWNTIKDILQIKNYQHSNPAKCFEKWREGDKKEDQEMTSDLNNQNRSMSTSFTNTWPRIIWKGSKRAI